MRLRDCEAAKGAVLSLEVECKSITAKGQEYKDQIHDIFVKQGITDGLKTAYARLVEMLTGSQL